MFFDNVFSRVIFSSLPLSLFSFFLSLSFLFIFLIVLFTFFVLAVSVVLYLESLACLFTGLVWLLACLSTDNDSWSLGSHHLWLFMLLPCSLARLLSFDLFIDWSKDQTTKLLRFVVFVFLQREHLLLQKEFTRHFFAIKSYEFLCFFGFLIFCCALVASASIRPAMPWAQPRLEERDGHCKQENGNRMFYFVFVLICLALNQTYQVRNAFYIEWIKLLMQHSDDCLFKPTHSLYEGLGWVRGDASSTGSWQRVQPQRLCLEKAGCRAEQKCWTRSERTTDIYWLLVEMEILRFLRPFKVLDAVGSLRIEGVSVNLSILFKLLPSTAIANPKVLLQRAERQGS